MNHKAIRANKVSKYTQVRRSFVAPVRRDADGDIVDECYLDTNEFKTYAQLVRAVIERLGCPNIREIKDGLGESQHERWNLFDVLEHLVSDGAIVYRPSGSMSRYYIGSARSPEMTKGPVRLSIMPRPDPRTYPLGAFDKRYE